MRHEAVFCWVVRDVVCRKIQIHFFAVNFYFSGGKGSLEAIRNAFVICAKRDGESAVEFDALLVVVIADLGKLLAHNGLYDFVMCRRFRTHNLRAVFAQHFVIDVHRERAVFHDRAAAEHDVVVNAVRGSDPHFDPLVGRFEIEARLLRGHSASSAQCRCKNQHYYLR